jgi:hypothetical protein
MKKILLKTTAILLMIAGSISCSRNMPEENKDEENIISTGLHGTKWKLEGFVDVQTGELEKVVPTKGSAIINSDGKLELIDGEPIDCAECYTLMFIADSITQGIPFDIVFFDPIQITSINISFSKTPSGALFTFDGVPPTLRRYREASRCLTSYICYNNELKLFYNNDKNYLLYKLVQP